MVAAFITKAEEHQVWVLDSKTAALLTVNDCLTFWTHRELKLLLWLFAVYPLWTINTFSYFSYHC